MEQPLPKLLVHSILFQARGSMPSNFDCDLGVLLRLRHREAAIFDSEACPLANICFDATENEPLKV